MEEDEDYVLNDDDPLIQLMADVIIRMITNGQY